MSGRDFGRGGRGGFGGARGGGFGDRDQRRGGFGDREGGNFRDRERGGRDGGRDFGAPPSRPWERRDGDERPARPSGDRPFDRPPGERSFDRPPGPPPERDVRVERYADTPSRPPREDRPGDRPARFGGERDTPPRPTPSAPRPDERPTPAPRAEEPKGAAAAAARPTPQGWSQEHLLDSWNDEARLKGWTPSDQDLREMVEDNIEADPQVPGRDGRAINVQAQGGVVTLSGTVRSRAVKFAAGSDAYWTFGVSGVQNELEVRPRSAQTGKATVEAAPAKTPKRVSKANAAVAAMNAASAANPTPTPEEVATPENDATATTMIATEQPATDQPASDLDETNVTPEELAVPENQAAPDMIESDDADEEKDEA